ncbi:MAG: cobyrinate a,c-diamide synthase, partial [Firmicutes bacterium]|nr:cobyrinate a,c-diamide synthase [Bacillota bacterium]
VMGYYDGLGIDSTESSSYHLAKVTGTPVVLIVNSRGMALSVVASIKGFLEFRPDSNIKGVILNNCTESTYNTLKGVIEHEFNGEVKPLGFMPKMADCSLESRHLGLVTAQEVEDLNVKLAKLRDQALTSIDLDGIMALAESAPELGFEEPEIRHFDEKVRIGVARDKAFCFYYEDSLKLLEKMGAELVDFSPLEDDFLPSGLDGLYLGGGYPELYAEQLASKVSMRGAVLRTVTSGVPTIAECGGFMYLTEGIGDSPMVGVLPGECSDQKKLMRFGYITLRAEKDNMLMKAGHEIPAHEFHHWDCTETGSDFTATKKNGRSWKAAFANENLYAGFPHFNFWADPSLAENFIEACIRYKENKK